MRLSNTRVNCALWRIMDPVRLILWLLPLLVEFRVVTPDAVNYDIVETQSSGHLLWHFTLTFTFFTMSSGHLYITDVPVTTMFLYHQSQCADECTRISCTDYSSEQRGNNECRLYLTEDPLNYVPRPYWSSYQVILLCVAYSLHQPSASWFTGVVPIHDRDGSVHSVNPSSADSSRGRWTPSSVPLVGLPVERIWSRIPTLNILIACEWSFDFDSTVTRVALWRLWWSMSELCGLVLRGVLNKFN